MFGLMRPIKTCGQNTTQKKQNRIHYCGTCKVIGKEFGHSTRMSLNHDTVFLAELLSALSEDKPDTWSSAYQAVNQCFVMPTKSDYPLALSYAAAANVFLLELKLDDNIRDQIAKRYKIARWFLSKKFKKAANQLANWGLDIPFFWEQVALQTQLEKARNIDFETVDDCVTHFAVPTARMTSAIFAQAAEVLEKPAIKPLLAALGEQFGRLAYALDAFEDLEKDIFSKAFNPLVCIFKPENGTLPEVHLEASRDFILRIQNELLVLLAQLPIGAEQIAIFQNRLQANLALRLYCERLVYQTFSEKINQRWKNASQMAANLLCQPQQKGGKFQLRFYSALFFILPTLSVEMSQQNRTQFLGGMAIFTAILAGLGLLPSVISEKKKQGFWQRLKNKWTKIKKGASSGCEVDDCCDCDCEDCCGALILGLILVGIWLGAWIGSFVILAHFLGAHLWIISLIVLWAISLIGFWFVLGKSGIADFSGEHEMKNEKLAAISKSILILSVLANIGILVLLAVPITSISVFVVALVMLINIALYLALFFIYLADLRHK